MNDESITVERLTDIIKHIDPDFEVVLTRFDVNSGEFQTFKISGLSHISFFTKTVVLEGE